MSDFLNAFTRALSGYYGPAGVRILLSTKEGADGSAPPSDAASVAAMHARVHLCSTFRQARCCMLLRASMLWCVFLTGRAGD